MFWGEFYQEEEEEDDAKKKSKTSNRNNSLVGHQVCARIHHVRYSPKLALELLANCCLTQEEDGQREKSEDERWRSTFANDERKSDEGSARCRVRVYGRGVFRGDLLLEHGGAVSHRVLNSHWRRRTSKINIDLFSFIRSNAMINNTAS